MNALHLAAEVGENEIVSELLNQRVGVPQHPHFKNSLIYLYHTIALSLVFPIHAHLYIYI